MSQPDQARAMSRILVALDSTSSDASTLAVAAELAARLQAELQGLFVEDVNLLRLAGLPFAKEIGLVSPVLRPLNLDVMERTLRGIADQVRQSLGELAERLQVPWSFHVMRGQLVRLPLEIVEAADLLILCGPRSQPQSPRTPAAKRTSPVLVIYDGTAASERALAMALDVSLGPNSEVIVLLSGNESEDVLRKPVELRRQASGRKISIPASRIQSPPQLLEAVRQLRGRLLILGRNSRLLDDATLESLVNEVGCAVGLVR